MTHEALEACGKSEYELCYVDRGCVDCAAGIVARRRADAKLPEVAQMAARLRARNRVASTFHPSCIFCQNYGQPR